jgi:hypothetical protein
MNPMQMIDLIFGGKIFPVPTTSLVEFFEHRPSLRPGVRVMNYAVQSSVPLAIFEIFADSLKNQTRVTVTQENAVSLASLAMEFCLSDLRAECAIFSVSVFDFASLFQRVSRLEREISPVSKLSRKNANEIESHERTIDILSATLELVKSQRKVDIPKTEEMPLVGVISYLPWKRDENGQLTKDLIIKAKSIDGQDHRLTNVLDPTSPSYFLSSIATRGQWICWDFCRRRLCVTDYTISAFSLKSWVLEGSLDGMRWTEMDRKTDNQNFKGVLGPDTASFTIPVPVECRFIRLIQTAKNHSGYNSLILSAVEFFGTLYE